MARPRLPLVGLPAAAGTRAPSPEPGQKQPLLWCPQDQSRHPGPAARFQALQERSSACVATVLGGTWDTGPELEVHPWGWRTRGWAEGQWPGLDESLGAGLCPPHLPDCSRRELPANSQAPGRAGPWPDGGRIAVTHRPRGGLG